MTDLLLMLARLEVRIRALAAAGGDSPVLEYQIGTILDTCEHYGLGPIACARLEHQA